MGTIADKLNYLNATKVMLRDALMSSGARLTNASPFRDYVAAIPFAQRTLDLDFARNTYKVLSGPTLVSKNFTDLITFTRASGGGRFNHLGQYEWLAANDTPRFGFDPATVSSSTSSVAIGAGQLTFAVTRQYALGEIVRATADASNYVVGKVIAATASSVTLLVDSDGFTGSGAFSSWTLIVSRGLLVEEQRTNLLLNSASLATQSVTTSATTYTLSFYGTGTVTLSGTATGSTTGTGAGNRVTRTFTATAGTLTLSVTGSCTDAQLEAGGFATSLIPTTGAQVTRAADVAYVGATSPWFSAALGTLSAAFRTAVGAANGNVCNLSDGTTNNRIGIRTSTAAFLVNTSGASQAAIDFGVSVTDGALRTIAGAYRANDFSAAVNGALGTPDTAGSVPAITRLDIGSIGVSSTLNGWVSRVAYVPRRITNAELQAVTA